MGPVQSMAELRRKHAPGVSRETLSQEQARAGQRRDGLQQRGRGVDWSPAEMAVLQRQDMRPCDMTVLLPDRTASAIYIKRHRLGIADRYRRPKRRDRAVSGKPGGQG
jgi:hypothetical protein